MPNLLPSKRCGVEARVEFHSNVGGDSDALRCHDRESHLSSSSLENTASSSECVQLRDNPDHSLTIRVTNWIHWYQIRRALPPRKHVTKQSSAIRKRVKVSASVCRLISSSDTLIYLMENWPRRARRSCLYRTTTSLSLKAFHRIDPVERISPRCSISTYPTIYCVDMRRAPSYAARVAGAPKGA